MPNALGRQAMMDLARDEEWTICGMCALRARANVVTQHHTKGRRFSDALCHNCCRAWSTLMARLGWYVQITALTIEQDRDAEDRKSQT